MIQNMTNPASRAAGRAPGNLFSLAANSPETTEKARSLQEIRAAWIARRAGISINLAETIAPLLFSEVTP